jgi:hypothetical protein
MKKIQGLLVAAAATFALIGTSAHADTVWNFTYSGSNSSASGSFTTTGDGSSPSLVTSISGTYSDATISNGTIDGLVALNTDGGFNYDDLFGGTPLFNTNGLLFDVNGGQHVNLYSQGPDFYNAAYETPGLPNEVVSLSVTAAVPEAGPMSMLLAGLGALAFVSRRKARN